MKKMTIVFCILILFGCSLNEDENTIDVFQKYIGYKDDEAREKLVKRQEEINIKTGYALDGKDSYLLGGVETLTMSSMPGKVYTQSIGQVEIIYDRETDYAVDATINELITTIYDYDTHETIKTLDVKEILDSSGDYLYVFGCRENEIVEENEHLYLIYYVIEKEKDRTTYADEEIKLMYINIETEETSIRKTEETKDQYKYKQNLGILWNTNFAQNNDDNLNNLRVLGYNYYWQNSNNSNMCKFRINIDELTETAREKLYEKFPTLEEDIKNRDDDMLTLYLETDDEEILDIFGSKEIYDYANVELDFRYTKSGKNETVDNSEDMVKKLGEEYILE